MTETPDDPEKITIIFQKPPVRPGTPEAQERGCLCRFESNMEAAFLAADEGMDETILVIHKDCPLHKIVRKPDDPGKAEEAGGDDVPGRARAVGNRLRAPARPRLRTGMGGSVEGPAAPAADL